jgi:regulator of protease activity HflC (stomatin/prohibitin superfamily)
MTTTGRGDFDLGGSLRAMPDFRSFRNRFLRIVGIILVLIVLYASTTSIPTGNVGVLTLFGRVTGDVLDEGIHLINPLKAVQKLSIQTQSIKESANTPSNEGLMLALDTSLLFRLDRTKAAQVYQTVGRITRTKLLSRRCAPQFAPPLPRTPLMPCIQMLVNSCSSRFRKN